MPPSDLSDARLRSDIREMGRVLGEIIREQWGEDFYNLVEEVRVSTRALRESPDAVLQSKLTERLDQASPWEIVRLVRSFTIYFHLANTAEQHHRISLDFVSPQPSRPRPKSCATSPASCTSAPSSPDTPPRSSAAPSSPSSRPSTACSRSGSRSKSKRGCAPPASAAWRS
jgi:hypothetical protein